MTGVCLVGISQFVCFVGEGLPEAVGLKLGSVECLAGGLEYTETSRLGEDGGRLRTRGGWKWVLGIVVLVVEKEGEFCAIPNQCSLQSQWRHGSWG